MAKKDNLLAQENGQYYNSMSAVQANVDNYMNLVQSASDSDSDYVRELILKLEGLISTLKTQENTFYHHLGIEGPQALKNLQKKVDEWNKSGAAALLDSKTVQGVFDIVIAKIDDGEFLSFVNEYLDQNTDWIEETLIKEKFVEESVAEFFNVAFENIVSDKKVGKFNKGMRGLDAQLVLTRKQGSISIAASGNKAISNGMKNKIMTILKTELEKKGNVNAAQLQKIENMLKKAGEATIDDEIISFLNSRIPNALTMSYIAKEINRKEGAYARWGNYYVIQGYLGEVYWNACVNYLFGNDNVAKALGNQKNISGKSLSVDMFARGAGFQIKTWHLKEVEGMGLTHNSSTEMYFGNFLQSRAQILKELTGQIIARLFGSISYNLPDPDRGAKQVVAGQSESYLKFYNQADSEWPNTMDELALLFRANLSEILGISGKNAIADNGEVYYNTFWAINDKIIPSSLIIEELITSLKQQSETSLVDFEVNLKNVKSNPVWSTPPSDMSDQAMANRWKIQYSTCFNMTRLLDAAAKKA